MSSFLLLVTLIHLSSAAVVEIEYDSCGDQGSWTGNGLGGYGKTIGCVYSSKCHYLNGPDGITAAGEIQRRFDTRGYSDIYMKFDIATTGYEASDFCWVLYSVDNGINWIEVNKYNAANDGQNRYIYFPPSVNDNYNFKIKFLSAASTVGEYCAIDRIYIYGISPKHIPYDSSILIFEDIATSTTDADWTWSGNNNGGGLSDNCLGTVGCSNCHCFQIKGGSNPGRVQKMISTIGYIHISVEFDIRSIGIDSNEYCIAWYTDNGGSIWYNIDSLDFTNDGKRYYFLPSSCSDNNEFGLRFSIQASSSSSEVCYIDIIRINGDLPTPSPTPSPTNPTIYPTSTPTSNPTRLPTNNPSISPTTAIPTISPTTAIPTVIPTLLPTSNPSYNPTYYPSINPTIDPTKYPTIDPTIYPTIEPTIDPSNDPTIDPTYIPTMNPTFTYNPTSDPTTAPTNGPSESPTSETREPTFDPTEPNGRVSEKTTTKQIEGDNNNNNQQESVNIFDPNNLNMALLIILTISVVFICIATYICFWCLIKKKKKKIKKIEPESPSNTQQIQHSVMEIHKIDKMDETRDTELNGIELFKVASFSSDIKEILQQGTLENVTSIQETPRDPNIDEDEGSSIYDEEGSSVYDMGLRNNDNTDDDDDDDEMYNENGKITEGNNNVTVTQTATQKM